MSSRKRVKGANIPGQPSREEFIEYAGSRDYNTELAGYQWDAWDAGDWCDGSGTPIINWKLKLVTFATREFGCFAPVGRRRPTAKATGGTAYERKYRAQAIEEMERINREAERQRDRERQR